MTKSNLNFYVYSILARAVNKIKKSIPASLIRPACELGSLVTIGVTTYEERYDQLFKPLYQSLTRIFPDVPILVAVNGSVNSPLQEHYLKRFKSEICDKSPDDHRFVLHDKPVGLTTLWNELLLSSNTPYVFLLNDDLRIYPWLRRWLEVLEWQDVGLTLLNSTWSHFIISKQIVSKVGYFDPDYPGIGFEDMDYTARADFSNVNISNKLCAFVQHQNHQPEVTSFDHDSERIWGKYTSANHEYFFTKWRVCASDEEGGAYIRQIRKSVKFRGPSLESLVVEDPKIKIDAKSKVMYPDL